MKREKRAALYVRVSTSDQSTKAQEAELREYVQRRGWSITQVYADKISGITASRPALDELMKDCRQRKLDVVLVWKFDRFARSLRHLVTALEEFRRLGIDFISATEGVDTTVPSGELVFQIFGAIAQFERALIGERVRAGLRNARAKGKRLGRPSLRDLSVTEIRQLRRDRRQGRMSFSALAKRYGVSVTTEKPFSSTGQEQHSRRISGRVGVILWLPA